MSAFPQTRFLMPSGDMSPQWRMFLQNIYNATGGPTGIIYASGITVIPSATLSSTDAQSALTELDLKKVPVTRTVNGHPLSSNVTVTVTDIGAVPTSRQVNGHALSADVTLTSGDVGAVPTTRQVNGHALSADVTLTAADVGAATIAGTTSGGGSVTQLTSKSTGVTLNGATGQVTMNAAALAATTTVTFTLTNSSVAAKDIVLPQIVSGNAGAGTYQVWTEAVSAGSVKFNVRNMSAGSLSEALVIGFAVVKSVTA